MMQFFRLLFFVLISLEINAQTALTATIVNLNSTFCTNSPINFSSAVSGGSVNYSWAIAPNNGLIYYSDLKSNSLSVTFSTALSHTIFLQVSNSQGTFLTTNYITVYKTPLASFNASLSDVGYPNALILTNYSTSSLKQNWIYNDVAYTDTSRNTVKTYNAPGNYSVTLLSIGGGGCSNSMSYSLTIEGASSVTLPNIFTPNDDGVNDVYRPITKGIRVLKAYVFSRGEVLIATWDHPLGFWDGRTISGEPCSSGIYYIVLHAIGFDGKDYKLKGPITLWR